MSGIRLKTNAKKRRPVSRASEQRKGVGLFFELVPVSLLDKSGQTAAVFRLSLERITGCRSLTVLDGLGNIGGDFLFQFDVVEAVFHRTLLRWLRLKVSFNITSF